MEQRADRVVGVDAADPLDGRLRDRLAVGDDRERLERGRREADRVHADVAGDQRAGVRRGDELDAVAATGRAGSRGRRGATSRSPSRASTVARSTPASGRDLAPGERPLGDEQERLELGLGELARRPGRIDVEVGLGRVSPARRLARRSRERLQALVERRVRRRRDAARAPRVVARATIGPHGSSCVDDDLAPLHQLEHREERDRDDDPVADAARAGPGARSSRRRGSPPG